MPDTDLLDALAPLRELEPTDEEIARVLASTRAAPRRRRRVWAVAMVAATAAVAGVLAALPGGDSTRPRDAHGILQAAAAAAAQQPVPGAYRYGDGPLAEVPFRELPEDATALEKLLDAAIRDLRWAPGPGPRTAPDYAKKSRWAPGHPKQWQVDQEIDYSAALLLSMGNLTGGQRAALFELLARRPAARALGTVADAVGRRGEGVALPLPGRGGEELRVIIDPKTSDILQTSRAAAGAPAAGEPRGLPRTLEITQVFLSTGSVAALEDRP